jgi:hypothetical protein
VNKDKIVIFYLIMLIAHVAHVFEEILGRFWLLDKIGLGCYLGGNLILLCIPVSLFFFVLKDNRWAYKLSVVYSGFMGLQGIGHNVATLVSGKYFDGFAGGYSGIVLLIICIPMTYYLLKGLLELPKQNNH